MTKAGLSKGFQLKNLPIPKSLLLF